MSARRLPIPDILWRKHVVNVLRVLVGALQELRRQTDLPSGEEDLNRTLYLKARQCHLALPNGERPEGFNLMPTPGNPPAEDEDVDEKYVGKRPDFKWRMCNDYADDPRDVTMDFDIESKRLGRPTSRTWVLNREYVTHGILRFVSPSHRYGNGVNAGVMIGYIQTMSHQKVHAAVNKHIALAQATSPDLSPIPQCGLAADGVHTACQHLSRRQVDKPEFDLHHLWVDVRGEVSPTTNGPR